MRRIGQIGLINKMLPLIVGGVLIIFFFYNNLFNSAVNFTPTVGTNDYMDLNIPFRQFLIDSYKQGEIPTWSSQISSGYPILAEGQIGAFYPLNILTIKMGALGSYAFGLAFTYLLVYIFTYLYLREIKIKPIAAVFGASVVTFSGFYANEILHFGILTSGAYFIGIILLIEKFVKSEKVYLLFLMSALLGLSILGGHPQIIIYSLLFIYPYFLVRWLTLNKNIYKLAVYIAAFSVLGLGIGAGQLLPQYEFTSLSDRSSGLSAQEISRYSFPLSDLTTFFDPFGNYAVGNTINTFAFNGWPTDERYVYSGIVAFTLLLLGLKLAKNRNYFALLFYSAFVLSMIFSFGGQLGTGIIYTIPPLSYFRIPFRIIFITNFSIGVICALVVNKFISLENLFDQRDNKRKNKHSKKGQDIDKKIELSKLVLIVILFLISYFDLYYHAKKLYPEVDGEAWVKEPEVVSYINENLASNERVSNQSYFNASIPAYVSDKSMWNDTNYHRNLRNLLPVFNNLLYDIPKNSGAANSGGIKIARYNSLEQEVFFNGWEYDQDRNLTVSDSFLFLNRIMGVRYVLTNSPFTSHVTFPAKKIDFDNDQDPIFVVEFFDYFPRQFMVPKAEKAEAEEIFKHLMSVDFEPKQKIFIEEDTDWGAKGGYSASSDFEKYSDTEVVINTQASGDGFLFLSDTYYPGWKATVDGEDTEILRANYAFRAVRVPEGEHEVVFKYEPDSLKLGLRITIGTSVIVTIGIITGLLPRKRDRKQHAT